MTGLEWLVIKNFIGKHWKALACLIVLTVALGWAYHKGHESAQKAAEAKAALAQAAQLKVALANTQAALAAAIAASERNDHVLPEVRKGTAGRVSRAATADQPQRVRDSQEAIGGYQAAASELSGTHAR